MADLPDPVELARLSARMDAEVRAEQADYERMALRAHLRDRDLAAVARDLVVRGDVVEVHAAGIAVRGVVTRAGRDVAVLAAEDGGVVDVRLPAVTLRVARRVRDGGGPPGAPVTFAARMTEHEIAGAPVRLITRDVAASRTATIEAVARDHLWVREHDGHHSAVPIDLIAMVRRPAG